jgi:hypothetical protein
LASFHPFCEQQGAHHEAFSLESRSGLGRIGNHHAGGLRWNSHQVSTHFHFLTVIVKLFAAELFPAIDELFSALFKKFAAELLPAVVKLLATDFFSAIIGSFGAQQSPLDAELLPAYPSSIAAVGHPSSIAEPVPSADHFARAIELPPAGSEASSPLAQLPPSQAHPLRLEQQSVARQSETLAVVACH